MKEKPPLPKADELPFVDEYAPLINEIKSAIRNARTKAIISANRELIGLYWNIGKSIVERQEQFGWGKSIVQRLSSDLKTEFRGVQGYSASNLWFMRQFYRTYREDSKLQQLVREIPWGQNILIFSRIYAVVKSFWWGTGLELNDYAFGGGTACGGSPWPKPPRPQSRAAGSLAHPFLRKWAAMSASGRRSPTPATLTLGRKHR